MKKIFFIGLLLMTFFNLYSQGMPDTIEVKKSIFRQNGKRLAPKQLLEITKSNSEAYKEMGIAKINHDIGSLFALTGGFFIGLPIGTFLAGSDPNWALVGIGVGLACISIPFSTAYTKHAKNAVKLYNDGLKQNVDLRVSFSGTGVSLRVTF